MSKERNVAMERKGERLFGPLSAPLEHTFHLLPSGLFSIQAALSAEPLAKSMSKELGPKLKEQRKSVIIEGSAEKRAPEVREKRGNRRGNGESAEKSGQKEQRKMREWKK